MLVRYWLSPMPTTSVSPSGTCFMDAPPGRCGQAPVPWAKECDPGRAQAARGRGLTMKGTPASGG
jgi:hypothetical protein